MCNLRTYHRVAHGLGEAADIDALSLRAGGVLLCLALLGLAHSRVSVHVLDRRKALEDLHMGLLRDSVVFNDMPDVLLDH